MVGATIPGFGLAAQCGNIADPAFPQALAAEEADLDLSLVQPASMFGRVMHSKTIPQPSTIRFAETVNQRLASVGAQVVYDQMDGVSGRIVLGDFQDEIGKLRRRTRGRHFGEMNPRLRFDSAENVGRATAFVLIVPSCDLAGPHRNRRPRIFMEYRRLFVDANHWLLL